MVALTIVVVAFIAISAFSLRAALFSYLLLALTMPVFRVGDLGIRIELVLSLWLFYVVIIRRLANRLSIRWHRVLSYYVLWLLGLVLSTLLGMATEAEFSLGALGASAYGVVRPLFVAFAFLNADMDRAFQQRVTWMLVWCSIPLSLLSLAQALGIGAVQSITLAGFTSPERGAALKLTTHFGRILRATSVFESPVYNGNFLVLVMVILRNVLTGDRMKFRQVLLVVGSLALVLIAGISTQSSTFILAGVVLLVTTVLGSFTSVRPNLTSGQWFVMVVLVLLTIPGLLLLVSDHAIVNSLKYQFRRLASMSVLESRYSLTTGNLVDAYVAIRRHPFFGYGLTPSDHVFVGDSMYIVLAYQGGVVGLGLFLLVVWQIIRWTWLHRDPVASPENTKRDALVATMLLLMTGLGSPSFFIPRLQEWYWALVGLSLANVSPRPAQKSAELEASVG